MNIDFHKLKPITFVTVVLIFLATICSGLLFIFVFSRKLFIEIDTFKLLLLSLSITTPFWLVNSAMVAIISKDSKVDDVYDNIQITSLFGSFFSIPVFCVPILIKIFTDISIQYGVGSVFLSEFAMVVILLLISRK